jgi:Bacteriophage T4-like capsid assembly protein (Gp20).
MEKIVTQPKRHSVVDQSSCRIDLRYNPMSIEEDYFIPVRQGSATDITNLAGGQNTTQIEDVKYLRDKLFSALKIPQAHLAMREGAAEDKTTLAQKDIRFARTIQRLQRVIIAELVKIGIIHLYTLGFRRRRFDRI